MQIDLISAVKVNAFRHTPALNAHIDIESRYIIALSPPRVLDIVVTVAALVAGPTIRKTRAALKLAVMPPPPRWSSTKRTGR